MLLNRSYKLKFNIISPLSNLHYYSELNFNKEQPI